MDKNILTKQLEDWLREIVKKKYSNEYCVDIFRPKRNLNLEQKEKIKKLPQVNLLEFSPHLVGILTNKVSKDVELIFIFRKTDTVGFTLIGEIRTYCQLAKPKLAIPPITKEIKYFFFIKLIVLAPYVSPLETSTLCIFLWSASNILKLTPNLGSGMLSLILGIFPLIVNIKPPTVSISS